MFKQTNGKDLKHGSILPLLLMSCALLTTIANSQESVPPELQEARGKYDKRIQKNFDELMADKDKIKKSYLTLLDKETAQAQAKGKLQDLVTLKKRKDELAGLRELELVPADPGYKRYSEKLLDAEVDKAKADRKTAESYQKYLKKKTVSFTKSGNVELALAFDTEHKRIQKIIDDIDALPFMQKKLSRKEILEKHLGYKLGRHLAGAKLAPEGAVEEGLKGHWYMIIEKSMTWKSAQAYCQKRGGYLACVTSKSEDEFILSLLKDRRRYIWFGGTDEKKEGRWQWITGEEWKYSNWLKGQPNNFKGKEHYLKYYDQQWADSMDDENGKENFIFIIEWEE